jgi:hypothetical protein
MTAAATVKPHVVGLRDPKRGWFYVAECAKCDWSVNWDAALSWERVLEIAAMHYWLYADTRNCYAG